MAVAAAAAAAAAAAVVVAKWRGGILYANRKMSNSRPADRSTWCTIPDADSDAVAAGRPSRKQTHATVPTSVAAAAVVFH